LKITNFIIIVETLLLAFFVYYYTDEIEELTIKLDENNKLCEYLLSHEARRIVLTAYNSHVWQTDDTPDITASGTKTSYSTLALSRDLIKAYNDKADLDFGDSVRIFIKNARVEDTMNRRYKNRGDMWTDSYAQARMFGKRDAWIIYKKEELE